MGKYTKKRVERARALSPDFLAFEPKRPDDRADSCLGFAVSFLSLKTNVIFSTVERTRTHLESGGEVVRSHPNENPPRTEPPNAD